MMGTRRANGEGSIYYNKIRNCWEGQFQYDDLETGKTKKKKLSGVSKTEVAKRGKAFVKSVKAAYEESIQNQTAGQTVGEWLDYWLETFVQDKVKVKTYERYYCSVHQHIVPYIGKLYLIKLKTEDIQAMLNKIRDNGGSDADGLSPRTVNSARRTLIGALNKAVDLDLIKRNPALATTPCKVEKASITVLTEDERQRVIMAARQEGKVAYVVVLLALTTGMRIGEIFGLHWDKVDLTKGQLMVTQTLVSSNHGFRRQDTPKTQSSYRSIPLPQMTVEALTDYLEWQKEQQALLLNQYVDKNIVVINQFGGYLDPSYFSYVTFKKILKAAEIKRKFRFHDLRHTHATFLLEQGINVKVVSERLGHSSIRITLDTYSHVVKSMQDDAVAAIQTAMVAG